MTLTDASDYILRAFKAFKRKIVIIDPGFKVLAASGQHIDLRQENILGRLCHQVFYDRASPCDHCPVREVRETGKAALRDFAGDTIGQDGISCLYAYPLTADGSTDAFVVLDISLPVLDQLEEKLHQANAFLRNLIHSAVDGVIAADRRGKILIFNDAAADITGWSEAEALHFLHISQIYPPGGARRVMQELRGEGHGGRGKLRSFHVNVLARTGEEIPISLNAAIMYDGEIEAGTIGIFHDVREMLKIETQLKKTQNQLLQAEKMASLGKLAAGVAHQLNNPLGGITLFAKLILEEHELADEVRDDLNRILKDAKRCRDTVRELLEFARQTRRFMKPEDINQAIARTLFLLENQTLFHNIRIEKNLAPDLPLVTADVQQLNHLFMNIILNAAQAMEESGRLTITTALSAVGGIRIEVADTGPGIAEEVLPHIFEPFYTTKEQGKGTGLGLSMAYAIVENHRGKIFAESKAGKGTTFVIELPIGAAENEGGALER